MINSVASAAQANSTEIAQLKRERQASDRQIAELGKLLADYIATSREERSTLFEMIQSLNDSRVETGETIKIRVPSPHPIAPFPWARQFSIQKNNRR